MRTEEDIMPAVRQALPAADHVELVGDDLYRAWGDAAEKDILGYVALGEASGYGGPMLVAVAVSPGGEILGAAVVSHKETPSWMERMIDNDFIVLLLLH